MSDAPSTKLIDGAIKEGDANGVLGMHAVDDPIKSRASISVFIEREITWYLLIIAAETRYLNVNF